MKRRPVHVTGGADSHGVLKAGMYVTAGAYRDVESGRDVVLVQDGVLPAAFDGRVAVYVLRPPTWGEIARSRRERAG
jgi:hypothetical protein